MERTKGGEEMQIALTEYSVNKTFQSCSSISSVIVGLGYPFIPTSSLKLLSIMLQI